MKVVILAGGMPSTLTDEREKLPKPMVKIGEKPILWHIMKKYAAQGFHVLADAVPQVCQFGGEFLYCHMRLLSVAFWIFEGGNFLLYFLAPVPFRPGP